MTTRIFSGFQGSLYNRFLNFKGFMKRFDGAEFVDELKYEARLNGPDWDINKEYIIYHLSGVTIIRKCVWYKAGPEISIELAGDEKSVDVIKKRILDGAAEISHLEDLANETSEILQKKKL